MKTPYYAADVDSLSHAAELFAAELVLPASVYLSGELGAGKTTFVRAVLQALGYTGRVKSPTYSLVESYEIRGLVAHHLDLYRLNDPEELEYIGFRDLCDEADALFIEWPERALTLLPPPSWQINIDYADSVPSAESAAGRVIQFVAR